jgi:hypothetical protein
VIRDLAGSGQTNSIFGSRAWGMYLGTPYGVPVAGATLVMLLRCLRHPLRVQLRTTVVDTL